MKAIYALVTSLALVILLAACNTSAPPKYAVVTDLSGLYTGTLNDQVDKSDSIAVSFRLFKSTEVNTTSSAIPYFANFTLVESELSSLLNCLYKHDTLEAINLICQNDTQEFSFLLSATRSEIVGTGILITSRVYTVDVNLRR